MAQHIPIELIDDPVAERIEKSVRYDVERSYTGLRGSMKWSELPKDYCEDDDTAVYSSWRNVPNRLVYGGRAEIEVHMNGLKTINAIYLVA